MAALSKILRSVEGGKVSFWCPGCDEAHVISVGERGWSFNGDLDKPTFSPSILVTSGHFLHGDKPGNCYCDWAQRDPKAAEGNTWKCTRCHSYVKDGAIQFLTDCSHNLAGSTVALPEFPA